MRIDQQAARFAPASGTVQPGILPVARRMRRAWPVAHAKASGARDKTLASASAGTVFVVFFAKRLSLV